MSKMYFSPNGEYGEANSLIILDKNLVTDKIYELLDQARANEKYEIAIALSKSDTQTLSEIANEYDIELEIIK